MAQNGPVKHAVRPPAGPPRALTVMGALAAVAAAVLGTLALWHTPGTELTSAHKMTVSALPPAFPLPTGDLTAALDGPLELGPFSDPARRASCLAGLGYPASAPILGARQIHAGDTAATVLILGEEGGDATALAVASTCSAADTGLLARTEVPTARRN